MNHRLCLQFLLSIVLILPTLVNAQTPANDECSGATLIPSIPFTASQNTRLATPNASDPSLICADGGKGKTVWYKYTADSTRYVTFSTASSSPSTYDVALALYTGTCGSLVEVDCNDDIIPGSIRQAELTFLVQAGTTYILHVAEWKGGGPEGGIPTGGDLVLNVTVSGPLPPKVKGPKSGSVASGAVTSTGEMPPMAVGKKPPEENEVIENEEDVPLLPTPKDVMPPLGPEGSNYKEDRGIFSVQAAATQPVFLKNFKGFDPTGAIPPDPTMAVGPNHVIAAVNSSFQIWDKNGTLLRSISLDSWFSNVKSPVGFSDPQVIYDHYPHRWIIGGGGFAAPYTLLLSISDDDNPLGTWYNYSLPASLGDSVTGNLPDYPQMGYDEAAIYITTREFNPGFRYDRLRIIPKAQLYTNTAGPVSWKDFWDFREPQHLSVPLDGIRPSIEYGAPGVHFLINASPFSTGTFFTVWTVSDPIGSPTVNGANVPVVQYTPAPSPNQPGGSTNLFEGGGSVIRHKAIYRDSSLWVVHSIASGTGGAFSAVHYARINPFAHTNLEDVAMGVEGYWHFYSALMVDAEKNVFVTFTRSGNSEYAGAFVSGHRASDPPGLSASVPLRAGVGHYDVTGSGTRNRWGDYMGIGLDPIDSTSVWMHTEFASATDTWGTWIGKAKMAPVPGKFLFAEPTAVNYGMFEVGTSSDTISMALANYGLDSLTISAITLADSNFELYNTPTLPLKLASFETAKIFARFKPKVRGSLSTSVVLTSDDSFNPTSSLTLSGFGFTITPALSGELYSASGSPTSNLLSVNPTTGAGSPLGSTSSDQLVAMKVNPATLELNALASVGVKHLLVRVNSAFGDAHPVATISQSFLDGMAFRGETLYVVRATGVLYRVNTSTGALTQVASTGLILTGIDFNPVTGQLWASGRPLSGGIADKIYKISLPSGITTLVGPSGLGATISDIAFDANGNLFATVGTSSSPSRLALIDTATGLGSIIGPIGSNGVLSLATHPTSSFNVFQFNLTGDWNMFSIPLEVGKRPKSALFSGTTSEAFSFEGSYVAQESLEAGKGYWLKFSGPVAKGLSGSPNTRDTVDVKARWNLIGSASVPLPLSAVGSIPPGIVSSNFFAYTGGGYLPDDSLIPGHAYWVRANSNGKLILNTSSSVPRIVSRNSDLAMLERLNWIELGDGRGNAQRLYVGEEEEGMPALSRFDLPPAPPEGGFDARFASQRIVELHPAKPDAITFPILLQSKFSSLEIRWGIRNDSPVKYTLVASDGKSPSASIIRLRGEGRKTLGEIASLRLQVRQNSVPEIFALEQNYPNPFNPTTTVRYAIPQDAEVRLVVYDLLGKEVATLVNDKQEAGYYEVPFSAGKFASGLYFYRLTAGSYTQVRKMMLLK